MSDIYKEYDPIPKTVNGTMYCDLIRDYAAPAVNQLYPEGSAWWQDDPATIHRCKTVLATVDEVFSRKLDRTMFRCLANRKCLGYCKRACG